MNHPDSYSSRTHLQVGNRSYTIHSLARLKDAARVRKLPTSLKILLENLLRHEDGSTVRKEDIAELVAWDPAAPPQQEIAFMPARVLLQDFTGIPCAVDLAVMRDAIVRMGGDPRRINPMQAVDLVIDHSVQVDEYGTPNAFRINAQKEFERNRERYAFLRWSQQAFTNFRVVPPDTGIVHQVNLEYLARVIFSSGDGGQAVVYPDTLVGTDSHTTMINGLGVLGWGVGGIEAEAAMLGQPISMLVPEVVGMKLTGTLPTGATATDAVLTVTQMLRKKGVVGKFVEFYGPGVSSLSLADRATIANMAPEYGATMGYFPVDDETLRYLSFTGRSAEEVALVEAYTRSQGMFGTGDSEEPLFSDRIELDLGSVEPSLAGPKRPQDRVSLKVSRTVFRSALIDLLEAKGTKLVRSALTPWVEGKAEAPRDFLRPTPVTLGSHERNRYEIGHGTVVIAAITSCTNTSNPSVMMAAGLLAKKAVARGLLSQPWVKTSLAPGSKVVTDYLKEAGLMEPLEALGFHLVGYGCTTCIGNSGPLPDEIARAIQQNDLVAASVLSGNRNFEGRVNPHVRANYLASPPLVVAYAIAGTMDIDMQNEPLGKGPDGKPVYLRDVWPSPKEVDEAVRVSLKPEMFRRRYANVFEGEPAWKNLPVPGGDRYDWDNQSTYIKPAPFFEGMPPEPRRLKDIRGARLLALLGDSVTTDHISPAGSIQKESPAGTYLIARGVQPADFNSYGARRGNHEVMMRGTFANVRFRNLMVPGKEGGWTLLDGSSQPVSIYDAAVAYQERGIPLLVVAGKEYGSGSSRDWAAKGPRLLGVRTVIAESFERIHRSNLIGMGILPLQFVDQEDRESLGLTGFEVFDILGIAEDLRPGKLLSVKMSGKGGAERSFRVKCRLDTPMEVDYYRHDGILQYVLHSILRKK